MDHVSIAAPSGWRSRLPDGIRPYTESAPIASFFLGRLLRSPIRHYRVDADDAARGCRPFMMLRKYAAGG